MLHARLQVAVFLSICNLPWIMKPLIGFVSDTMPLWGYRRRSYLLVSGIAASVGWLTLYGEAHDIEGKRHTEGACAAGPISSRQLAAEGEEEGGCLPCGPCILLHVRFPHDENARLLRCGLSAKRRASFLCVGGKRPQQQFSLVLW